MKLRKKGQIVPMVLAVVVVLFTLANAGANMVPYHWPTKAERLRTAQDELIAERRVRIAVLSARVDPTAAPFGAAARELPLPRERCDTAQAQELARALVYDGQSARAFGVRYQTRCGDDDVVQKWAALPAHPWATRRDRSL